jgi:hypothetical protein
LKKKNMQVSMRIGLKDHLSYNANNIVSLE